MALVGDVFYFRRGVGVPEPAFDRDVSSDYAVFASRSSPRELVEWRCTNGGGGVRYFLRGREVEVVEARAWKGGA